MQHDDYVLARVDEWQRLIGEDSRRFLMLYRERDGQPLTADVLEIFSVDCTRDAEGKLRAWLFGLAPAVESGWFGRKTVSWSRQLTIPLDQVAYRERLEDGFPGFDSFEAGRGCDGFHLIMKQKYGEAVRRALKLARERRLS